MSEIRSTLNDLIETCKDSQEGFHSAAEKLKDPEIHTLFLKFYLQRSEFAGELQAEVTRLGGEPATSGSTAGAIHRGWIGLKTALAADSDHAILEEAERGEDAAMKNYIEVLRKGLPSDLESIVSRQFREIQQAHRTIRELLERHRTIADLPMAGLP
ncbi:MAG: PA2169 family four-helix-bundle protein [Bryobacteraceae bacterium]